MKLQFLILAGLVVVAALTAAPGDPKPRGRIAETLALVPAPATADQAWSDVAALIEVVPPLAVTGPVDPAAKGSWSGYIFVQEAANRTLRELGLRFARDYPDDPRVWIWLAAALDRAPRYVDLASAWLAQSDPEARPAEDVEARAAWHKAFRHLADRCVTSQQAPEDLRVRLWVERIARPLEGEMWARVRRQPFDPAILDFEAMGADLDALAAAFPASDDSRIRNVASRFLQCADRYAPESAAKWRAVLARNPNVMLQHLAGAEAAIAAARARPMTMVFTALDGRVVDLEKLRGKVVLIDFRGVTWCGACRDEEPYMKEAYAKFHDQGFEIVTITYEMGTDRRAEVEKYIRERGLVWPHYFDGKGVKNPYILRFGITGVPQHFLLDQRGLLVSTDVRGTKLEPAVRQLLQLPTAAVAPSPGASP